MGQAFENECAFACHDALLLHRRNAFINGMIYLKRYLYGLQGGTVLGRYSADDVERVITLTCRSGTRNQRAPSND
jgi:hypothetical protein